MIFKFFNDKKKNYGKEEERKNSFTIIEVRPHL